MPRALGKTLSNSGASTARTRRRRFETTRGRVSGAQGKPDAKYRVTAKTGGHAAGGQTGPGAEGTRPVTEREVCWRPGSAGGSGLLLHAPLCAAGVDSGHVRFRGGEGGGSRR